jgi:hypothetical protein
MMVCVYPLGIPLFMFAILYSIRENIKAAMKGVSEERIESTGKMRQSLLIAVKLFF